MKTQRIRTVEKDSCGGWIARSPFDGRELCVAGDRWNTRSSAWHVVWDERHLSEEGKRRAALAKSTRSAAPQSADDQTHE
jgi:hypothetical protein